MWGVGVTSFTSLTLKPLVSIDFLAVDFPGPTPLTKIVTSFKPNSFAFSTAAAAASPAAYGVFFFVPLYPIAPEELQAKTFPFRSEKETIVFW